MSNMMNGMNFQQMPQGQGYPQQQGYMPNIPNQINYNTPQMTDYETRLQRLAQERQELLNKQYQQYQQQFYQQTPIQAQTQQSQTFNQKKYFIVDVNSKQDAKKHSISIDGTKFVFFNEAADEIYLRNFDSNTGQEIWKEFNGSNDMTESEQSGTTDISKIEKIETDIDNLYKMISDLKESVINDDKSIKVESNVSTDSDAKKKGTKSKPGNTTTSNTESESAK